MKFIFVIESVDREKPRFIDCPGDITQTAEPLATHADVDWRPPRTLDNSNPYTSDNPPGVTINVSMQPGNPFQLGETRVNYTATDAAGNVAVCSFVVNVKGSCLFIIHNLMNMRDI